MSVPLQGAAHCSGCCCVRFGAGLLVPLQGAAVGCCFRGLLSECGVRYEAWVLASLQGVAARCLWQCGHWALMEITFVP